MTKLTFALVLAGATLVSTSAAFACGCVLTKRGYVYRHHHAHHIHAMPHHASDCYKVKKRVYDPRTNRTFKIKTTVCG